MEKILRQMMNDYGDYLLNFIETRKDRLSDRAVKEDTEFNTIWNVAENEGRKRELKDLIIELNKYV